MAEFQGEQAQVTAVEQKAAKLDDKGKKTHEQLDSELKVRHDVFFKQVNETQKTFKEADQLTDPAAKTEIGKDKQEIKDLLIKAATSGEAIYQNKKDNPDFVPDFLTIRQSADRITRLSSTVGENLAFFKDMGLAGDFLKGSKEWLSKAQEFETNGEKPKGWQKDYRLFLDEGIGNIGGITTILSKYPSIASPELKVFSDKIKKAADANLLLLTESRLRFFDNFADEGSTYIDDEGKEQKMNQEQKDAVNKLKTIRNGGKGGPKGESYEGYSSMMSLISSGKAQVDQAGTAADEKQKQVFLDSAKEIFTRAKDAAYTVGFELAPLDAGKLPGSFLTMRNIMESNSSSVLKEATAQLDLLEKGTSLVDGKAVLDAGEKDYAGDPKKNYEAAIAARDKVMSAKDLDLSNPELKDSTENALTGLCALKGKLADVDRTTLPREYQARFDALSLTVDTNIRELAQVQILVKNKALVDDFDKNGLKYFRIIKKSINGQDVVIIEQTEEFKKLTPDKQKLATDQFIAVQAGVTLDLTRKINLTEDKDWNDGITKFESGNWQGAKKQLLDYFRKYQNNPEKAVQIGSATGLLQQIVKMEFQEAKSNLALMEQVEKSGQDFKDINHQELGVAIVLAWKKMDSAETIVNSGKYLDINDIWAKVGPPMGKDLAVGRELGGTDLGITGVGTTTVDKVSFMNPKEISSLLSEPNPKIRKNNILKIARDAQAAGMTPFAKKYFEMYFADEIAEKEKTVTRDQIETAFNKDPDNNKKIQAGISDAWEQAKKNFYTERNRKLGIGGGMPSQDQIDAEQKDFAKFEADYNANAGNLETRIRNSIIDDLWTQEAKKSINAVWKNSKAVDLESGQLDPTATVNVWNEAYGGHTGVAENISGDTLIFTSYDMRDTAAKLAVSILYLEIAAAAGALTGGMASAAILGGAAEVGVGTTMAAQGVGFLVEGAVMHTVSVGLNEGAEGFKDPKAFFKGLATTYATIGIMKGVGAGLGKLGGKAVQGVVEGSGEFITPFSKGLGQAGLNVGKAALELTGKSVLDSALMTGLSYGTERILSGKKMTSDELIRSFGENFVTFMVMGATHSAVDAGEKGGGQATDNTKEGKAARKAIGEFAEADAAAKEARTKADAAEKTNDPNAAALEADALKKEGAAKTADKKATDSENLADYNTVKNTIVQLRAKLAEDKKKGPVDPQLEAQLKILEVKEAILKARVETVRNTEILDQLGIKKPADIGEVKLLPSGELTVNGKPFDTAKVNFDLLPPAIREALQLKIAEAKTVEGKNQMKAKLEAAGVVEPADLVALNKGKLMTKSGVEIPLTDFEHLPDILKARVEELRRAEVKQKVAELQPLESLLHQRQQLEKVLQADPKNQQAKTKLAEIDSKLEASAKERGLTKEKLIEQITVESRLFKSIDAIYSGEQSLYHESKIVKKPVLDENGVQKLGPDNQPLFEDVNLFANYETKTSAYSTDLLQSLDYATLVKEGGSKLIKIGGDEIVLYHAGPDGIVQKLFIDISNMGPTNDTAINIKGSQVNLVDIYLSEIGEFIKGQSKSHQGKTIDQVEFMQGIDRVSKELFALDRGANGEKLTPAEAEAKFNKLKTKWGLDGKYEDYQKSVDSLRVMAEYRADTRSLDSSYKDAPKGVTFEQHITTQIEKIAGLSLPELQKLIVDHPDAFAAALEGRTPTSEKLIKRNEKGEIISGPPSVKELIDLVAKLKPGQSKAEDLMPLYNMMARLEISKLKDPAFQKLASDLQATRSELIGQPPHPRIDSPRIMDAKVVSIDLPPEVIKALQQMDPVQAHAILTAARTLAEKPLDALKYNKSPSFAQFNVLDHIEVVDGKIVIKPGAKEFLDSYNENLSDKKVSNIAEIEKSLQSAKSELEKIRSDYEQGKLPIDQFKVKMRKVEAEITKLEDRLSRDPDTGAFTQAYLDLQPARIYGFEGGDVLPQNQILHSVTTELGHAGAINSKYGYKNMDGMMKAYHDVLQKGIGEELPGNLGHFKIIRSGGGKFQIFFLDARSVEALAKKGLTPESLIQRIAEGPGQQAIDAEMAKDPVAKAKAESDAAVRNSLFKYMKGNQPLTPGKLTVTVEPPISNAEITAAKVAKPTASGRELFAEVAKTRAKVKAVEVGRTRIEAGTLPVEHIVSVEGNKITLQDGTVVALESGKVPLKYKAQIEKVSPGAFKAFEQPTVIKLTDLPLALEKPTPSPAISEELKTPATKEGVRDQLYADARRLIGGPVVENLIKGNQEFVIKQMLEQKPEFKALVKQRRAIYEQQLIESSTKDFNSDQKAALQLFKDRPDLVETIEKVKALPPEIIDVMLKAPLNKEYQEKLLNKEYLLLTGTNQIIISSSKVLGKGGIAEVTLGVVIVKNGTEYIAKEVAIKKPHPTSTAFDKDLASNVEVAGYTNTDGLLKPLFAGTTKDGYGKDQPIIIAEVVVAKPEYGRPDLIGAMNNESNPSVVVDLFEQSLVGLETIHANGSIHMDFKPAQVMVGTMGEKSGAFLGDFSFVKASDLPFLKIEPFKVTLNGVQKDTYRLVDTRTNKPIPTTPSYLEAFRGHLQKAIDYAKAHPGEQMPQHILELPDRGAVAKMIDVYVAGRKETLGQTPNGKKLFEDLSALSKRLGNPEDTITLKEARAHLVEIAAEYRGEPKEPLAKAKDFDPSKIPVGTVLSDGTIYRGTTVINDIEVYLYTDPKSYDSSKISERMMYELPEKLNGTKYENPDMVAVEKIYNDLVIGTTPLDLNNPEQLATLKLKLKPVDFTALQNNKDLSPEVLTAVIRGGRDFAPGLRVYDGRYLGMGGYGAVSEIHYIEAATGKIKTGVIKTPHPNPAAQANFNFEVIAAREILAMPQGDPKAQHLIKPILVTDKAIIYEKASDAQGKTTDLEKSMTTAPTREWLQQFAGGVDGLVFMHENGIAHNDFKPANIVAGPEGGVLIDIGSKVSTADISSGKVQIKLSANGSPLAHYVVRDGAGVETAYWVAQDPKYNNAYILAEVVAGRLPLDVSDKFAVGKSIAEFLQKKGYADAVGTLSPTAPPAVAELRNLASLLIVSADHPYPHTGNNPSAAVDPYYINLATVTERIKYIATKL